MTEKQINLVIGCLLHDVGKVIYRTGDRKRSHSASGYEFVKEETNISDKDILNSIRYHHADALRGAKISEDSLAYITYIADNIASAVDRRENGLEDYGFEMSAPLESVFNILNNNDQKYFYKPRTLDQKDGINYPSEKKVGFSEGFYKGLKQQLKENLNAVSYDEAYINSILSFLEAELSYVPSSTNKQERADISLFDHVKITAAFGSSIEAYLAEKEEKNYKECLWKKAREFYSEKAFLIYSMDISGIQDFIYTVNSEGALKNLRARSFYLEIMMEHIVDGLLEKLNLSRANVLYIGGGHCYLLLANTDECKNILKTYEKLLNQWFLETYGTALYIAGGYSECCAYDLQNKPEGSYESVFHEVSKQISEKKVHRYTAKELLQLNHHQIGDEDRECKVCKRTGKTDKENQCEVCSAIRKMSDVILQKDQLFFSIMKSNNGSRLPLPGGYYLDYATKKNSINMLMDEDYVRGYIKNSWYTGKAISTKIWVGDYSSGRTFEEYAALGKNAQGQGVERMAVLRVDVDNLGQAFVSGFNHEKYGQLYVTLSRTAALSRHLSLFFKFYINQILKDGQTHIFGEGVEREVSIVYSGGDDVFLVGSWRDVLDAAIDLREALKQYTQNTLKISGGVGIYPGKYPIHMMAQEVAKLEECSKRRAGKDALTLFYGFHQNNGKNFKKSESLGYDWSGRFGWDELENKVIKDKLEVIQNFFEHSDGRGKGFLYKLLDLMRHREEKINFARLAYVLARLEPDQKKEPQEYQNYKVFSEKMYEWMQNEEECRQAIYALYLYTYQSRESGEKHE